MKKKYIAAVLIFCISVSANAADLMQVFHEALVSDPTYQQAVSQRLSTREGVPISLSNLLPSASIVAQAPNVTRILSSGPASGNVSTTQRGYNVTLNLS